MKRSESTVSTFQAKLLEWYESSRRNLPWRKTKDPYKIWVSEVMLQQTTVRTVLSYYEKWLRRFPDIKSVAEAQLQEVLKVWQGLGYYQRARNLHKSACLIEQRFQGKIPENYDELRSLPGFGPYTAAAVLSLAFNKACTILDANVRRVAMRLWKIQGKATPRSDKLLHERLKPFLPRNRVSTFNQALMELGSLVCKAKNPLCLLCPLKEFCQAYAHGVQEIIPEPKKVQYQKVEAVVGILYEKGKFLIQKRPSKGLLADLWEFPGGKIKDHEGMEQALRRELKEELSVEITKAEFLVKVQHAYTHYRVTLYAFLCRLKKHPKLNQKRHRWVRMEELRRYPFPSGSARIIDHLERMDKERTTRA